MALARKKIGLLVETSLGSGREILKGIARYARYSCDWQLFHAAGGLSEMIPDWLENWDGDGIIARIQSDEVSKKLSELKIPVVDVLGVCKNRFPLVHVDDEAIAKLAALHFSERNFRHFAFYGIEGENWSMRRAASFRNACETGESFSLLEMPRRSDATNKNSFQRLQEWVRGLPKPVGIMVCSDQKGLELLEACLNEEIPVPEQVAVIGVDNDAALCEIADPPLTSIRGGHSIVGHEAAAMMDRLLQGQPTGPTPLRVSPVAVIERESSGSRAIDDPTVAKGVKFIREHLSESINNDSISRAAGISRTLFQKRFREAMGTSIREHILTRRIERATSLIEQTDIPLAEIACRSGFRHQEYLGQVIKKATGDTPGELRRKARDGDNQLVT